MRHPQPLEVVRVPGGSPGGARVRRAAGELGARNTKLGGGEDLAQKNCCLNLYFYFLWGLIRNNATPLMSKIEGGLLWTAFKFKHYFERKKSSPRRKKQHNLALLGT